MGLSQEIINVLDYLGHKFGIAIDWTSENIMPYLEELCGRYIQYEIYTSIAWCALPIIVLIIAGLLWTISGIVLKHSYSESADWIVWISRSVFFVFLVIGVIVWAVQGFDIITCYTLPEKVILEYLKTLANSTVR